MINKPTGSRLQFGGKSTRLSKLKVFLVIAHLIAFLTVGVVAQDTVTGAFQGDVFDFQSSLPIPNAVIKITSVERGEIFDLEADSQGRFFQGKLLPGLYNIAVSAAGFNPKLLQREIKVSETGDIIPVPVALEPVTPGATPQPTPTVPEPPADVRVEIITADPRRSGSYREDALNRLPLGGTTITRSFDELALLLPGVAPPPQTIGDVAGPGVGPGVGSAGQFAVNGIRSRANNFTVDGSDNNDEDIGVRRQGFVALVPQPIESIKEFQIQTLLAPAQYGRNIGAQVNAVSKTGGNILNGSVYGFFNSHKLNARNEFDTNNGNETLPVRTAAGQNALIDGQPLTVRNQSGGEDTFTFAQGGGTLGGAIVPDRAFYFVSGEYQKINATKEKSFAVPTVEQRGPFRTGATGISTNFFDPNTPLAMPLFPTASRNGSLFSFFPFPNNPQGVYGENTFTQILPASGRGAILSGRLDNNFAFGTRQQSFTARYNFTDDEKNISAVNEALFSTVLSKIRTHNLSLFLNSELDGSGSGSKKFNQVRFSYGRTRLVFDEVRDTEFLVPSTRFPSEPFLLNTRAIFNVSLPQFNGQPRYTRIFPLTTSPLNAEDFLGPIGQINVGGFSPIGVDVFNFPQDRINQTYQLADDLSIRAGRHSLVFGVDLRRTDLDSDLPRLSRGLVTFNGSPRLVPLAAGMTACQSGGVSVFTGSANPGGLSTFCFLPQSDPRAVIRPEDVLGFNAASNFLLNLNVDRPGSQANFRYYQTNFYAQDTWRPKLDLSISFGLRYEYNSPVKEINALVEDTFTDARLAAQPFIQRVVNGRTQLYEPDYNNFAPRVGVAYSTNFFGGNRVGVIRAGYGLFYDQILGAVANQSRNVFPSFVTVNLSSFNGSSIQGLNIVNPSLVSIGGTRIIQPNTLNTLNPALNFGTAISTFTRTLPNAIDITLPSQELDMPMAHQYSVSFEQQLNQNLTASFAYVGTSGRKLLRFTTPNLGPSQTVSPTALAPNAVNPGVASVFGIGISPSRPLDTRNSFGDLERSGVINQFETTGESRYNSFQAQLRARFLERFNMQMSYTLSKVTDDVSDVFDLAGAYVLPQDSLNLAAERGPANFDVGHRLAYDISYSFPKSSGGLAFLTDNLDIATTGRYRSGQPFTVNSVIDVNLDGNLTDRLNTTNGIDITGDRSQPLRLAAANPTSLLAPFGRSGQVGRNTFRAGSVLELDVSVIKRFKFGANRSLGFRTDIFNIIDRANYGIPIRLLEAPGFGRATSTVTPGRRVQFSLKYEF